ncbi:Klp68D, partial [Symbiodinium sp. CCMP2456]
EMYAKRNEAQLPLDIIQIHHGQEEFESTLKRRRYNLVPPTQITGYEMVCHLEGTWAYQRWDGQFVIREAPPQLLCADAVSRLIYVDVSTKEFGPLISPTSSAWERPPYGFPALFFVPLSSGASLWLRVHKADELRVCYLEPRGSSRVTRHGLAAVRASSRTAEPVVVSFIGVCMLHAFADGNCYLPLVKDLMTGYAAAAEQKEPQLAPLEARPHQVEAIGRSCHRSSSSSSCSSNYLVLVFVVVILAVLEQLRKK